MRITNKLIAVLIGILISAICAVGQSTNPSSPTPVNGQYTGKGPSKETNYYFSVTGGPGDVSVTLEIKAKDYSTFARMEIGNDPSNLIAMHNMNASTATGASSVTKQFKLSTQQTVRIRLTLDHNLAEYKLSVNGAGGSGGASEGTGTAGKIGRLTTGTGAKLGSTGSGGSKPKTGTLGSTGGSGKELSVTCPVAIEYQLVPIGDWQPGLYGKKRLTFDNVSAEGSIVYCTYSADSGDSSTILKKMPAGYVCSVYNGGPGNRIVTCTQAITARRYHRSTIDAAAN
jgi:hypothetical protein